MKTNLSVLAALLLPLAVAAQQKPNFTITGKVGTLNAPVKVYLDYMDDQGGGKTDSVAPVNGVFTFSGTISSIATARMAMGRTGLGKDYAVYAGGDVLYFYFGKEQVKLTSTDSLVQGKFTGSKVNDEYEAYNKVIGGSIMEVTKRANAEFAAGKEQGITDTAYYNAVRTRFYDTNISRAEKQIQFAKDHPASYFGLVGLSEGTGRDGGKTSATKIKAILEAMDAKLQATDMGKELAARLNAVTATAVGADAPLFTQNDVDGKPVSLASLKGKVVLVDFWASWCSPCRAESPNLKAQYALYKDKGLEIISVSLDDNKSKWTGAIAQDAMPWIQVSDLKGWNNAVGRLYGVRGVPAMFLVDKDGKIIGKDLRGESLNAKLAEVFKTI